MIEALTRDGLIAEIDAGWRRLDDVVSALSPADLGQTLTSRDPEDPSWTIADAVLHIAAWKRNGAQVARLQAEPGSEPVDAYPAQLLDIDTRAFNDALVRRRVAESRAGGGTGRAPVGSRRNRRGTRATA